MQVEHLHVLVGWTAPRRREENGVRLERGEYFHGVSQDELDAILHSIYSGVSAAKCIARRGTRSRRGIPVVI